MNTMTLHVNGRAENVTIEPRTHLADCLREELRLTGTHLGCEQGVCGACTVMLDGRPVRSCLTLAALCDGVQLRTIEGFGDDALMAALRAAFSRHHALQCGYCTPGMLITAYDIVRRLGAVDEARIRAELAGNLCRCTGYGGIVQAIADVMQHPPAASLQPIIQALAPGVADGAQAPAPAPALGPSYMPATGADGRTLLTRTVKLPVSAAAVWPLLSRVERVAALLPGANLTGVEANAVTGTFTAAIGPMQAVFTGRATVAFDDNHLTGAVSGSGRDPLSRTTAEGGLRFRLVPSGEAASSLYAEINYRLQGPLAQFGRPAVVAGMVDQVLERFTANIITVAAGNAADTRPAGGLRTVLRMILQPIRRLLSKS